ncbi:hypothetical protein L7D48_26940 [Streptomyces sp. S1A]|uniref:hypothetical protein n=1 Tax=Streptomyces sp. ICN903 TaxID=2964654 RepID=UPI001EDAE6DD|nr:hypothetical protein [Streptomyces sp. ICN903]MCG3044172.1 hypothetical protein [Streptomyces sp. ICN903]
METAPARSERASGERTGSPLPDDADFMTRDMMWFAYGSGADRPRPPAQPAGPLSETDVDPGLPDAARSGAPAALPHGTVDLLEELPFPGGRFTGGADGTDAGTDRLGHALVAAFGVHRREPENPFNDHRGYPSVRGKFPVQALVGERGRWQALDVYRHALVGLDTAERPARAAGSGRRIALAGRYTRLPPVYKWFRGSLVHLELGVNLRMLCTALELFGLRGRLRLPDASGEEALAALGLTPVWQWSLPLTVELDPGTDAETGPARSASGSGGPPSAPAVDAGTGGPDHVLAEALAVNRAQDFREPPAPLTPAIPSAAGARELSWAETLWRRTSGRMPRGLYGMNGRRRRLPAAALRDAVEWLALPPPGGTLRAVYESLRVSAVVQEVDGFTDGVHGLTGGELSLCAGDPAAAARLEEYYGYPLAPGNGCDVRHASAIWFLSLRPREVMERFGPGAWCAAQYAAGWAAQGLCLAAAAHGLYARPVRAFQEVPARRVLGLGPDEMIVFSVITGTPRYTGPLLDVRL